MSMTLRELRTTHGVSQPQMARELGVTEKTIRNWEHGQAKAYMAHAYCSVLHVSFEDANLVTLRSLLGITEQLTLGFDDENPSPGSVTGPGQIDFLASAA